MVRVTEAQIVDIAALPGNLPADLIEVRNERPVLVLRAGRFSPDQLDQLGDVLRGVHFLADEPAGRCHAAKVGALMRFLQCMNLTAREAHDLRRLFARFELDLPPGWVRLRRAAPAPRHLTMANRCRRFGAVGAIVLAMAAVATAIDSDMNSDMAGVADVSVSASA